MSASDVQWRLVALATLRMDTSTALLQSHLQFRKLSVLHLSTSFAAGKTPAESFCQIGTLVQETIVHVLHLFLPGGASQMPIRRGMGSDALGYGGFLFGKLSDVAEQDDWDAYLRDRQHGLEELTVGTVNALVEDWLKEVAQIVHDAGTGLLHDCTQLKSLSQLETSVKGMLNRPEWQSEVQERLGLEIDLWTTVFEAVVQEKCLSIVRDAFHGISADLKTKLQSLQAKLVHADLEPLGQVSASSWTLHAQKLQKAPENHLRSEALHIVTDFDRRLAEILDEVSEVLGVKEAPGNEGEHSPTASTKQGSVRSFSLLSGTHHRGVLPRKTHRSVELEPQIQSLWETAAFHLAQDLEQQVADLPADVDLQVVEAALLVGTTAMGLAENCPSMGLLSGPAEDWRPDAIPRSARSRSSVRPDPAAPPHLSNAFRHVAFLGVHIWMEWALEQLMGSWIAEMKFGNLTGEEHLQEIVVSHQALESAEDSQMKFSIPSAPSEQTMQLLMDTSQELQRLGFYSMQQQIIHSLQFKMEDKVRECLRELVANAGVENLSDNYVLQLLLDFRFLSDVFSAGAPVPKSEVEPSAVVPRSLSAVPEDTISLHDMTQKTDPAVKRAVAESQNQSKALEAEISSLLDPIDWATYEPHLWVAERRCYRRTQVLFGMIGATNHSLHSDTPVKLPMGSDTNCLQAAPVASRFQYLPVRPTMWTGKGLHSDTGIDILNLTELEEDPSSSYSFSDLGQTPHTSLPTSQVRFRPHVTYREKSDHLESRDGIIYIIGNDVHRQGRRDVCSSSTENWSVWRLSTTFITRFQQYLFVLCQTCRYGKRSSAIVKWRTLRA